jgi:hypothetical protein
MTQIMEKYYNTDLQILFIDFWQASDDEDSKQLFKPIEFYGIPEKAIKPINNIRWQYIQSTHSKY